MQKRAARFDESENERSPYEDLCNSIIVQASEDYTRCLVKLMTKKEDTDYIIHQYHSDKRNIEKFFRSEFYKTLTNVDGEYLISELQRRCSYKKEEEYAI